MPSRKRCRFEGLELDTTSMALPVNLAEVNASRIASAWEVMEALERGEHVNTDEDRPVGHYWLRAPELSTVPLDAADNIRASRRQIRAFAERVRTGQTGPFHKFLLIGIGGSALGPRLLHDVFREPGKTPPMFFLDNTDPAGFTRTLAELEAAGGLRDTLTIVVSKSGGTQEPYNGMLVVKAAYETAGLCFEAHAVAVTLDDPHKSKLCQVAVGEQALPAAEKRKWLEVFPTWDWVGGRTSLFSAVGLLPAALLGFDYEAICEGARKMDCATREAKNLFENPALLLAATWHHAVDRRNLYNMAVLPYSDRLALLGMYLQQLVMESLGKNGNGITIYGNKGSTDQHAFVQQLREGRRDFFVLFIRSICPGCEPEVPLPGEDGVTAGDHLAACLDGTSQALRGSGRLSMRLTLDRIDAGSFGALIALFERAVGFYAGMAGINAYHQPGVEAGKRAARDYIVLQRQAVGFLTDHAGQPFTAGQVAAEIRKPAQADRVYDILHRLACCNRYGLTWSGGGDLDADTFTVQP